MNRRVIDYELLENGAAKGLTVQQLMGVVGVSAGTWYKRMADDPEFKAAYVRGRGRNSGYDPYQPTFDDEIEDEDLRSKAEPVEDLPTNTGVFDEDDEEIAEPETSMREYILQAVGLGLHLPRQIAKDLSVPIYEVVRDADALVEGGELDKLEAVTFSGYYLPGTIPAGRPFLNGNGGIEFAIEAAASNGHVYSKAAEQIEAELIDASVKQMMAEPATTGHTNCWLSSATKTGVTVPLSDGRITMEADIDLFSATQAEVNLFNTICQAVRDFAALDAGE